MKNEECIFSLIQKEIQKIESVCGIKNRMDMWMKFFTHITQSESDFIQFILRLDDEMKLTFGMAKRIFEEDMYGMD